MNAGGGLPRGPAHRLILVEGLPGAGKTTTASWIAGRLRARGDAVHLLLENELGNALPLPDAHGGLVGILRAFARGNPLLGSWRALATRHPPGSSTVVEARFWQNSLMFMRLQDRPLADLAAAQAEVLEALRPLAPVLVLIDTPWSDVAEVLAQRIAQDPAWASLAEAAILAQPWFAARSSTCQADFYQEWTQLRRELARRAGIPVIMLEPAKEGWTACLVRLARELDLPD